MAALPEAALQTPDTLQDFDMPIRWKLPDGSITTFYVASYPKDEVSLKVIHCEREIRLAEWCQRNGVTDALVGGFFVRGYKALGDLWVDGQQADTEPFDGPWGFIRGSIHIDNDEVAINYRNKLPAKISGDLLQAGPLLVKDGEICCDKDMEGFSAGARQFDSDITAGRHPRAAIGIAKNRIVSVVCDGRSRFDAGATLGEVAEFMLGLGCKAALNLDGGGSASLVKNGELVNTPRSGYEEVVIGGRGVRTALAILPKQPRLSLVK